MSHVLGLITMSCHWLVSAGAMGARGPCPSPGQLASARARGCQRPEPDPVTVPRREGQCQLQRGAPKHTRPDLHRVSQSLLV